MDYQKLVAFQKSYDFTIWLVPILNKFPKSQRFTLAQQIENALINLLKFLQNGVLLQGQKRLTNWQEASRELDEIRLFVRIAKDLRFLSIKQYGLCAEKINEIGKYLSGLVKSAS